MGNAITNDIFQKQSEFLYGQKGWVTYLLKTVDPDMPKRKGAPIGMYAVTVNFMVYVPGKVYDVTARSDPSYGTKDETIRVIANGPKWTPTISNGNIIVTKKSQTITFIVSD